ncbi:methyltransferase family protein [Rhodovulum imhoffii]|uniref:Methyltransferase family protein n=1 Tax=Rhodovulum imhoffii TaxID=365340 RepID=A0A2T5BUQ2_9RHOB|nr:class I SAM-dependent methyltransferase [Rhodovulum imhoffii]PTN03259.1 methyltransferase family protein [Rhodovulum imhoffii]
MVQKLSAAQTFAQAPWAQLDASVLTRARSVPTMLNPAEEKLYYWLAAHWLRGTGDIVDLGCFAGGSTARLAEGLRAGRHPGHIHAFDRFTARPRNKENILYPHGIAPFSGHDILPLARRLLAPWDDLVTLHPGEIEDNGWQGRPIELLTIDAGKTAASADAIAEIFFPHLLPGQSIVVQQDFFHTSQPWLAAQMQRLSAFFTPLALCKQTAMVFQCRTRPDTPSLHAARTARLTDDDLVADIRSAQKWLRRYSRPWRFLHLTQAVEKNPGAREAWRFRSAP